MFQYDNQFVVHVAGERRSASPGSGDAVSGHRGAGGGSGPGPGDRRVLEKRLGYPYRALDWQTQNASLFSALQLEKLAMGLIIFFIMVVAAFNIVGTLTMVVTDKTKEIGILRAMGLTSPAVARVFLLQGAVIGVVGTIVGLLLGLVTSPTWWTSPAGSGSTRRSTSSITSRSTSSRGMSLVVVGASLAIAVLATVYPSRTGGRPDAGRGDPARMSAILEAHGPPEGVPGRRRLTRSRCSPGST